MPPGTARRRRLLWPGRRGAGGGVGRGGPARRRTAAGQRPEEEKKGGGARAPLARAVGGEGRPRALAGRRCGRGRGGRRPRGGWRLAGRGGGRCPARPDTSVGADLAGMFFFLGFRGEGEIRKRRGVYIGIEGARRVQMRCGFRPHDRDRTL